MNGLLIRTADVPPQPWRNGGGITRELLAWPATGAWRVRVSVADIASDGPFSSFPGVERWLVVLDGAGVELAIDGHAHRVVRHEAPLRFDGASATSCRLLDGPTRGLNLMLRGARGAIEPAVAGATWQPRAAQCGLFARAPGQCRRGATTVAVPAGALLWFDHAPAALAFVPCEPAPAPAWWIAATPTGPGSSAS